jgi:lysophospholipase L1-like esterase
MITSMNKKLLPMVLAAILISLSSCSHQDMNVYNDHIIDMWAQTLEPYSVDIAFYGDSRVALANWQEAFPDSDVVNLGIGGDIVEGTIQRLSLLEALDVKYCFLAIGVNNCNSDSFSEAGFRNNYRMLLDGLEDLGITVYVNTIAGVTTESSEFSAALVARLTTNITVANEIIRDITGDLAESRGLALIDIAEGMNNPDGTLKVEYSADGIHFSDEGNQFWYNALRPYMEAIAE